MKVLYPSLVFAAGVSALVVGPNVDKAWLTGAALQPDVQDSGVGEGIGRNFGSSSGVSAVDDAAPTTGNRFTTGRLAGLSSALTGSPKVIGARSPDWPHYDHHDGDWPASFGGSAVSAGTGGPASSTPVAPVVPVTIPVTPSKPSGKACLRRSSSSANVAPAPVSSSPVNPATSAASVNTTQTTTIRTFRTLTLTRTLVTATGNSNLARRGNDQQDASHPATLVSTVSVVPFPYDPIGVATSVQAIPSGYPGHHGSHDVPSIPVPPVDSDFPDEDCDEDESEPHQPEPTPYHNTGVPPIPQTPVAPSFTQGVPANSTTWSGDHKPSVAPFVGAGTRMDSHSAGMILVISCGIAALLIL